MVYRPPKSKPAGPGFPRNSPSADPLEGPLTPSPGSRPGSIAAGDDRNLVKVDDYAGADLEDKIWLFWHRHQTRVVVVVLIACVAVLAWQGTKIYQDYAFSNLQTAYAKAETPAALTEFAKANPATQLGKVAQLQAADAYYAAGKYNEAITAYDDAATLWGNDMSGQRARLGRAMAHLQKGDATAAKNDLEELYSQTDFNDNYRAQSAYFLAILAVQAGDGTTAGKWIDRAKNFPQAEPWPSQAADLAETASIISNVTVPTSRGPTNAAVNENPTPAPAAAPMNLVSPSAMPPAAAAPAPAPNSTPPPAAPAATPPPAASPGPLNLPPIAK